MKGKKLLVLLVILGLCCVTLLLAALVAVLVSTSLIQTQKINQLQNQVGLQEEPTSSPVTQTPVTQTPTQNVWTVSAKSNVQENSNYKIDIIYPFLANVDHKTIADDVNAYITSIINAASNDVTGISSSGATSKPFISLDYEVKFLSNNLVSIVISGTEYLGGAHPGSVELVVNYDLKNDKAIKLENVFNSSSAYLTTLSTTSRADLATALNIDPTDSVLVGGTTATVNNYKLFYFSGTDKIDTFGVIFSDYQVAPYAAGPQKVEINIDDLSSMYTAEFAALL